MENNSEMGVCVQCVFSEMSQKECRGDLGPREVEFGTERFKTVVPPDQECGNHDFWGIKKYERLVRRTFDSPQGKDANKDLRVKQVKSGQHLARPRHMVRN